MTTTVLVLSSNPMDTKRLSLEEEIRLIRRALDQGTSRTFTLVPLTDAHTSDLLEALRRQQPSIVTSPATAHPTAASR